jgi:hypothetical protein
MCLRHVHPAPDAACQANGTGCMSPLLRTGPPATSHLNKQPELSCSYLSKHDIRRLLGAVVRISRWQNDSLMMICGESLATTLQLPRNQQLLSPNLLIGKSCDKADDVAYRTTNHFPTCLREPCMYLEVDCTAGHT